MKEAYKKAGVEIYNLFTAMEGLLMEIRENKKGCVKKGIFEYTYNSDTKSYDITWFSADDHIVVDKAEQ